jgi:hypothetical protein
VKRKGLEQAVADESGQLLVHLEQSRYDSAKADDLEYYERAAQLISKLSKLEKTRSKKTASEGRLS